MNKRHVINSIMTTLTAVCAIITVGILLLILSYIALRGVTALSLEFLTDTPKPVGEGGGIGNAIVGSLIMVLLGALMGMPFGIAVGIYLSEFGNNRFGSFVRFVTDTLTGIPSIVVGIFIYTLIVLPMGHASAFAGSVALALIMLPIVARTTEEMIRLVPQNLREGALALGASQWRVTMNVVLPAAASGIATGAMLAVARVCGETAPLLFTALGSRFYNYDLNEPMASLTVQIYNYAIGPYDVEHKMAWAATLVLMTMILLTNIFVRYLTRKKY
jgi:phosphate transport system permease protein